MQSDDLQLVVDSLAAQLRRSVTIDDPSMRLLVASRHFGDEDPARVRSVLDRYTGDEETKFVLSQGIANWTRPGRVPAHPPRLSARLCVPVRCTDLLVGYLWLIDPAESVTDAEIQAATDAAEQVGLLLYRRLLLHEREQARTGSLLRDLVSSDAAVRTRAADEIREDQLLAAENHVVVLSAEAFGTPDGRDREQAAVALAAAVEAATRSVPPRTVLAFAHGCRALILLAAATVPSSRMIDELAGTIEAGFRRHARDGERIVIGIGSTQQGLAHAVDSHRHATTATRAARLLPGLGLVVHWQNLGPYALLLQFPMEQMLAVERMPSVQAICDADPHGTLLSTVEAFLDNAGDVQRTARQLGVHRTTLYHRLHRIEEVARVDLWDGTDRLTLHLGLKVAKLAESWQLHASR